MGLLLSFNYYNVHASIRGSPMEPPGRINLANLPFFDKHMFSSAYKIEQHTAIRHTVLLQPFLMIETIRFSKRSLKNKHSKEQVAWIIEV